MLPLLTFSTKLRFLKKRKLQRPTCCLDIWITLWGRYKYIFVKGKNSNISKSSIKVNLLWRIFKRSWKLKELSILTTSINSNSVRRFSKRTPKVKPCCFFTTSIITNLLSRNFQTELLNSKNLFLVICQSLVVFLNFFSHSKQNKLFSTKIISLYSDKADMILHHRAIMKT